MANIAGNYICASGSPAAPGGVYAPLVLTLNSSGLQKLAWCQAQHIPFCLYFFGSVESETEAEALLNGGASFTANGAGDYALTDNDLSVLWVFTPDIYDIQSCDGIICGSGGGSPPTGIMRSCLSIPAASLPTGTITSLTVTIQQGAGSSYEGYTVNCVVLEQDSWTDAAALSAAWGATPPAAQCAMPTFLVNGSGQLVISDATAGATMVVTTDGSTPSLTNGATYTGPMTLAANTYFLIQAFAYAGGLQDSLVAGTGWYNGTACAAPVIAPAAGTYAAASLTVSIGSPTTGATIRVTTNGSTPSETNGTVYSGPFTIDASCTVQAMAYLSGYADSPVASAGYTLTTPSLPGAGTGSGFQVTSFNLSSGAVTGGYNTPFVLSWPVRDSSAQAGIYFYLTPNDPNFPAYDVPYIPNENGSLAETLYPFLQYVALANGNTINLSGIGFPYPAQIVGATPNTAFDATAGAVDLPFWGGLFATDDSGNFDVLTPGGGLNIYPASGAAPAWYPWASYTPTLLQVRWAANGTLVTLERAVSGSSFKDWVRVYSATGAPSSGPYAQAAYLPYTGSNLYPAILLDVSAAGNVYGVDLSNNTVWGRRSRRTRRCSARRCRAGPSRWRRACARRWGTWRCCARRRRTRPTCWWAPR